MKLGDQLRALAAHLAGTDVDSARLDGRGGVCAGDRTFSYAELADVAYLRAHLLPKEVGPGLTATASFDVGGDGTFSNATHGCVVALDPGTGGVEILRYVCVEDCGVAIHPRVVEGRPAAASPRASPGRCSSRSSTTSSASRSRRASWSTRSRPPPRSPTCASSTSDAVRVHRRRREGRG